MRAISWMKLLLFAAMTALTGSAQTVFVPGGTGGIGSSSTGAVGIGTSAPFFKLDVVNDNYNAIRATGSSTNAVGIYIQNTATSGRQWGLISSGGGPSPAGTFTIWDDTAGAARFNIDGSGNVGIGTSNPRSALDISNGFITSAANIETQGLWNVALASTVTTSGGTMIGNGPTGRGNSNFWTTSSTGQWIEFDLGPALYILVDAVGFGTDWRMDQTMIPAGYSIDVSTDNATWTNYATATGNTKTSVMHYGGGYYRYVRITITALGTSGIASVAGIQILTSTRSAMAGSELWAQNINTNDVFTTTNGNVGIGTTTPGQKLDVAGVIRSQGEQMWGSGQLQVQWNNQGDSSDQRFTELIQQGGQFTGRFVNDAYSSADNWLLVKRNAGTFTVNSVNFPSGNVGIGTTNPTYPLSVNGTIQAKEVIVQTGWSDYVFDEGYRLAPLSEVEQHIKAEKHLPGIPSAKDVAEHGVDMGDMQAKLLAKIEELTLHQIEQEKQLDAQAARIEELEQDNAALRNR